MHINVYIHIEVLNSNMINSSFSHINLEYICIFQSPGGQGQYDWLQFSVRLGGQQCGSNYNTRIQYIFIERSVDRSARPKHDASALHPLHPDAYNTKLDRKIHNKWFRYDRELYCSPGMMINPDIRIVAGSVPTFYGEIESSGSKEKTMLNKLDQVSARVLCYTDKCFSMFAQSDKIHFKFYQRDDNCGTVYVKTHSCCHSPVSPIDGRKQLQHTVFGQPVGNDGTTDKGFNRMFEDLVKIALFMEQRAHNMYINSDRVNQFPAQPKDHPHHELCNPILLTLTGSYRENLGGSNLVAGVELWKWDNMTQ